MKKLPFSEVDNQYGMSQSVRNEHGANGDSYNFFVQSTLKSQHDFGSNIFDDLNKIRSIS